MTTIEDDIRTDGGHGGTMRLMRPFLLRHWWSLAGALLCTTTMTAGNAMMTAEETVIETEGITHGRELLSSAV